MINTLDITVYANGKIGFENKIFSNIYLSHGDGTGWHLVVDGQKILNVDKIWNKAKKLNEAVTPYIANMLSDGTAKFDGQA